MITLTFEQDYDVVESIKQCLKAHGYTTLVGFLDNAKKEYSLIHAKKCKCELGCSRGVVK